MAKNNISMDERMSRHEREFATRFSSAISQMAKKIEPNLQPQLKQMRKYKNNKINILKDP